MKTLLARLWIFFANRFPYEPRGLAVEKGNHDIWSPLRLVTNPVNHFASLEDIEGWLEKNVDWALWRMNIWRMDSWRMGTIVEEDGHWEHER